MKKVLMIAYSFPPAGGPGVQRTSKFVKYLRTYGWEPVILTRDLINMPLKDESLVKDIPDNINIIRTKAWDLNNGTGFPGLVGKFISRKVLIPDSERLWEIFSRKAAEKFIEEQNIQLIYTTSLPYSSHLMAMYLKKTYPDIPWVADFRDEWINNPYILDNPYNPLRMNIERKMEHKVLQKADYLITNTPVMLKNFIKNNPDIQLEDKFFVIPNGYDWDDFKHIVPEPDKVRPGSSVEVETKVWAEARNDKFTITYTGSFYGRRKPDIFFDALGQLVKENEVNKDNIHIKLIGSFKQEQIKELSEIHGLQGIVEVFSYMDHDECIQNMTQSDCLLLIEGAGPGAEAFYTGKVFEYMVSGRPILAIIPERGAAAQLIRETQTGLISDCTDLNGTKKNIKSLYSSWLEEINIYFPNKEEIRKYERNTLTAELAKVFDKAL
ncbi:MAG TPA: glycosyltransferase family 4 protein [Clostridiales bacterium]|nr:glycosyltransferase family 4 protein [Clostridiales bacterium]